MYGGPSMMHGAPPGYNGGYGMSYGAAHPFASEQGMALNKPTPFARRRRPTSFVTLLFCLLMPVVIFGAVYTLQCFTLHYNEPSTCNLLSFCVLGLVLLFGSAAVAAWRRRDDGVSDPKWYTFLFVTSLTAWICAFVFGNRNFKSNISPYLDVMNLNVYPGIDPSKHTGQQLMDAGRIIFTPETHLDLSLSMGFRNLDTYCVAPLSTSNSTGRNGGGSFDFWAVGINCCSGHTPDFHCGEFDSANAKSGLRLMRDDQRAFFRLAVQQAEAAYNIRAAHPLFFYWMKDPMTEIRAYQKDGYKFWVIGMGVFFGAQLVLLVIAAVVFWRFGI